MKDLLNRLFEGYILPLQEARDVMARMGKGEFSEAEIAAFLTVLRMRPVQGDELTGFREALLNLCIPVNLSDYDTIDVVGTGGDGKNTFNISTLSCFIIAGAGYRVTKHGNYGLSSISGASNMFEYFGYQFKNDPRELMNELEETGICFFHAPLFHPAMRFVGPVRKALKVRTLFNLMGPLINPGNPKNQLVGVADLPTMELYDQVFRKSKQNYVLVHSMDGYDEIALTAETRYRTRNESGKWFPADFGFEQVKPEELRGGASVAEAASIFRSILEGEGSNGQNQVVVANAAAGIRCLCPEKSLNECVEEAKESLASKRALDVFRKLLNFKAS